MIEIILLFVAVCLLGSIAYNVAEIATKMGKHQ
jgi:hypothetical protein